MPRGLFWEHHFRLPMNRTAMRRSFQKKIHLFFHHFWCSLWSSEEKVQTLRAGSLQERERHRCQKGEEGGAEEGGEHGVMTYRTQRQPHIEQLTTNIRMDSAISVQLINRLTEFTKHFFCRKALPIAIVVGIIALAGLYFYLNNVYS